MGMRKHDTGDDVDAERLMMRRTQMSTRTTGNEQEDEDGSKDPGGTGKRW